MKISYIKYKGDNESFRLPKKLGFDVFEIDDPETIDNKIKELEKKHYTSIFLTSEIAGFSENIINKYNKNNKINIIITPSKRIKE